MAVKLRLTRMGRRHRPFFRINAVDSRTPRDGKILEKIGHYDPLEKDADKQIVINKERVEFWLAKGAVPSDTVSEILLKHGIQHKYAAEKKVRRNKARSQAHKRGRVFTKAERILADKKAQEQGGQGQGEAAAGGAAKS
jgi:small subunit ribosomal protein S16